MSESEKTDDTFVPDCVSPPGDSMVEKLEHLGLSRDEFALRMFRTPEQIEELIAGRMVITATLAHDLAVVLGYTTQFWINRDTQYREGLVRLAARPKEPLE
jgi:plasmid maintenance system antidote protein VapI